jgi:aspartate kinase
MLYLDGDILDTSSLTSFSFLVRLESLASFNNVDTELNILSFKSTVLVSISSLDFSFIVEENISDIFKLFHKYQLKVNLIQNSAISFSVCVDNNLNHFDLFYNEIKNMYKVSFVKNVDLFTVRHFTENSLEGIYKLGTSLVTQINKNTAQIIIQKK